VERLDDGNPDTREEAVAGLGKRKELRVLPDLNDLLQQEEVSYGVVEAACQPARSAKITKSERGRVCPGLYPNAYSDELEQYS